MNTNNETATAERFADGSENDLAANTDSRKIGLQLVEVAGKDAGKRRGGQGGENDEAGEELHDYEKATVGRMGEIG
ncbi:hypothetical protein GYMLUDRAFT_67447 [Collybiopsis luxurians FD-317 M1]|nr:hypothetical protein GYMLUDRAFT_67447 [Collybiopsis luxurians FD-317 M1]